MMDNRQISIRKAPLNFQLRWAKNTHVIIFQGSSISLIFKKKNLPWIERELSRIIVNYRVNCYHFSEIIQIFKTILVIDFFYHYHHSQKILQQCEDPLSFTDENFTEVWIIFYLKDMSVHLNTLYIVASLNSCMVIKQRKI